MIFREMLFPRPTIKSPMQAISIFTLRHIIANPVNMKNKQRSKAFFRLSLSEYDIRKGIPKRDPIDWIPR